jgi:hypothetical protein
MKDAKAVLEGILSSTINSYVYPGHLEDADIVTAAHTYFPNGGAREGTSGDSDLSAMEIYKLYGYLASATNVGTDNTKAHVHAMVEYARAFGRVVTLYDHTSAAFSLADWIDVFDALNEAGATVMTLTEAVNYIKANGFNGRQRQDLHADAGRRIRLPPHRLLPRHQRRGGRGPDAGLPRQPDQGPAGYRGV